MTPEEAKRILALYRPGSADQEDPEFADALDLADPGRRRGARASQVDPDLSRWFRQHCSAYLGVRGKFQDIQLPAALKDQILAEYKSHITPPVRSSSRRLVLACVASVLVMASLLTIFFVHRTQHQFALYRQRVVAKALGTYSMDIQTNSLTAINAYLAGRGAPNGSAFPPNVKTAEPVGCAVIDWHGKPVTMVCFKSGKPLEPGQVADLWLFVADKGDVVNGPEGASKALAQEDRMATAAWSQDGKLYMIGTVGDQSVLQKYL
jgi:hypothetical protein